MFAKSKPRDRVDTYIDIKLRIVEDFSTQQIVLRCRPFWLKRVPEDASYTQ